MKTRFFRPFFWKCELCLLVFQFTRNVLQLLPTTSLLSNARRGGQTLKLNLQAKVQEFMQYVEFF